MSPHEGSSPFISEISEADSANFNKMRSLGWEVGNIIKISLRYFIVKEIYIY